MRKIFAILFAMIMGGVVVSTALPSAPVYAAGNCNKTVLGLRPWYMDLDMDSNCVVKNPSEADIPKFAWTIILNLSTDLFTLSSVVALIFIVWGGFKYMMSNGDPGHVSSAKKMITSAVIGLIIAVLASLIAQTLINVLIAARG